MWMEGKGSNLKIEQIRTVNMGANHMELVLRAVPPGGESAQRFERKSISYRGPRIICMTKHVLLFFIRASKASSLEQLLPRPCSQTSIDKSDIDKVFNLVAYFRLINSELLDLIILQVFNELSSSSKPQILCSLLPLIQGSVLPYVPQHRIGCPATSTVHLRSKMSSISCCQASTTLGLANLIVLLRNPTTSICNPSICRRFSVLSTCY